MGDYKEEIFLIIDLYNKISSYDEDSGNINMGNEVSKIKISSFDSSENVLYCKVLFLGDSGKTKMINSFLLSNFEDSITSTTGVSYPVNTMFFDKENQTIAFQIWDTPGQDKYRSLTKMFYKDLNVCILVYMS